MPKQPKAPKEEPIDEERRRRYVDEDLTDWQIQDSAGNIIKKEDAPDAPPKKDKK